MNKIINHEVEVKHEGCNVWMPYCNCGLDIEKACDIANALIVENSYKAVRVATVDLGYSWL